MKSKEENKMRSGKLFMYSVLSIVFIKGCTHPEKASTEQ